MGELRWMTVELEKHHREGYVWALNCCWQNHAAAEEVLQKVYVKILDGRARFRGEASFKTWFLTLIRNTAVDHWREENRRQANLVEYEQRAGVSSQLVIVPKGKHGPGVFDEKYFKMMTDFLTKELMNK